MSRPDGAVFSMPLYKFKVSSADGQLSELLIEGDSQADATRRIQRRGLLPLEFLGEGSLSAGGRGFLSFRQRFDIVDFTDRLVPLLEADVPLERALGIVGEGMDEGFASRTVADLRRGLHEGRRFSDLVEDRGRLFPRLYASAIKAGEEAGALPQVMGELRRFLIERRELRAFVLSSSVYPLFVLCSGLAMLAVVIGVIVPRFAQILVNASIEPSGSTRVLLQLSEWGPTLLWVLPAVTLAIAVLLLQVRRGGRVSAIYDRWILHVPLAGRMVLLGNLARMCRTMAILLRSGVHLLDTVGIANRVIQNRTLRQSLAGLAGELRQGERLSHALGNSALVPPFMIRMLAVGEETGAMETMLERVADRYETDLKRLVKRVLSLFEPAVIIALGLFVGLIVLFMFMAIMDMQSTL